MKKVILRFLIILILIFPTYMIIHRIIFIPQYRMINKLQTQLMKEKIDLIELNAIVTVKKLYSSNLKGGVTSVNGYQKQKVSNEYLDLKSKLDKAQTNNNIDMIKLKSLQKKVRVFMVAK